MDDALKLDIAILEALTTRNRTNHGRTIYYKRMEMVLQCSRRCKLLEFAPILKSHIQQSTKKNVEWDSNSDFENQKLYLKHTLRASFPELLSRIEYAARAFFTEIERGFFLNYCTVALAALARIRILVQHLGREATMELQKIGLNLDSMIDIYAPTDEPKADNKDNLKLLLASLGIQSPKIFKIEAPNSVKENAQGASRSDFTKEIKRNEDIGQEVGPNRINPVLTDKPAVTDHNFKFVKMKMAEKKKERMSERKRKRRNDEKTGKSKAKNTSCNKRDIFDDIFGD
mmetsp:Transcript_7093/g.10751  ORF Transcript_7093/g.10751 Transcript_7093/m.10751 type:complete len:286 (-) Transcript_7093:94-951(-)